METCLYTAEVGCTVGDIVGVFDGAAVGKLDGDDVAGASDGAPDGNAVGLEVAGDLVGATVGGVTVVVVTGELDGWMDGAWDGGGVSLCPLTNATHARATMV